MDAELTTPATPVGTSFMSRYVDFETVEEGSALSGSSDGGGFPAPAIPAADEGLVADDGTDLSYDFGDEQDPAAGEGDTAQEQQAWAGPSQQEWQQAQEALGQFSQLMEFLTAEGEPAAAEAAPALNYDELDLSDPETFRSAVHEEASRLMDERLGPYQPILDQQAQDVGEKMVRDHLDTIAKDIGEFDRDQALLITQSLLSNNVPPEQAFRQAAAIRHADEAKMKAAHFEEFKKQFEGLEDVEPEPAGGGDARPTEKFEYDPRDPDKYEQIAQRFLARKRAAESASG